MPGYFWCRGVHCVFLVSVLVFNQRAVTFIDELSSFDCRSVFRSKRPIIEPVAPDDAVYVWFYGIKDSATRKKDR